MTIAVFLTLFRISCGLHVWADGWSPVMSSDNLPTMGTTLPRELRMTENNGFGVFATEDIKKREIVDIAPVLFGPKAAFSVMDYKFNLVTVVEKRLGYNIPEGSHGQTFALGYLSLYNHRSKAKVNTDYFYDIIWESETSKNGTMLYFFEALRDIKKGEELFLDYGDNWVSTRENREGFTVVDSDSFISGEQAKSSSFYHGHSHLNLAQVGIFSTTKLDAGEVVNLCGTIPGSKEEGAERSWVNCAHVQHESQDFLILGSCPVLMRGENANVDMKPVMIEDRLTFEILTLREIQPHEELVLPLDSIGQKCNFPLPLLPAKDQTEKKEL